MKISAVNYANYNNNYSFKSKEILYCGGCRTEEPQEVVSTKGMNGDKFVMEGDAEKYFTLKQNISNAKVGSKFIIESKLPEYKGLRMLITPDSKIESDNMFIGIKNDEAKSPSFKGRLYGSIRKEGDDVDTRMTKEYARFWVEGMHKSISDNYVDSKYAPTLKDDYNFFIPSDGDGTRYKDITALQGGVTKPASYIPAQLNEKNMSLVQAVISNFAKTGKLDDGCEMVQVTPAKGSAYAFLEALRKGRLSTDKPLVFGWGDNFSDVNVSKLIYNHENSDAGFTITVIPVDKAATKSLSIIKADSMENKSIKEFTEKPQDDDYIDSCVIDELGKDKCLSAVGPYVLSAPVLKWIKENYTENPESFLNPDKGYDFSSMVIAPVLDALNNGEILDEDGNVITMKFDIISPEDTWSDLGAQKDFSSAMKGIKQGKYANLPSEMISSVQKNTDDNGNITFNKTARKMFDSMVEKLGIDAENVICYAEENIYG